MRILLVEDDSKLAEHLISNLKDNSLDVFHISSTLELSTYILSGQPVDLVILDRLLSGVDSKFKIPELRLKYPEIPILILSAINTPNERSELLDLGVDDYLGKPFSTQELVARVKALTRRNISIQKQNLQIGNLTIDLVSRNISVNNTIEALTSKEFLLLRALAQEPGRVWNKDELLNNVWGHLAKLETNVLESTVSNLRRKLELLASEKVIKNLRNVGYWFEK